MKLSRKLNLLLIALILWGCRSIFIYDKLVEGTKFANPKDMGILDNIEISEASGLVASNYNKDLFWTHNDSGDLPRIFLISSFGKGKLDFVIKGIQNRDWEDMGIWLDPNGQSWIYVADIGDNGAKNPSYYIYRFKEPHFEDAIHHNRVITEVEQIEFKLPDQSRDMESLLVDQRTGELFVLSKREKEKFLYQIPAQKWNVQVNAKKIMKLKFSIPTSNVGLIEKLYFLTGASVSSTNEELLVRNYLEIYYWKKNYYESIPEALSRKPKSVPSKLEPQGEAVAFAKFQSGFYTLSETSQKVNPVHFYFTEKLRDNHQLGKTQQ
jgi:hypothetical protein